MLARIKHEPALLIGAIVALLGLAMAFGIGITGDQLNAIVGFVWAVLALLGAAVTRSQVTPSTDVVARVTHADVGTDDVFIAGPAHPAPTGTPVELPPAAS